MPWMRNDEALITNSSTTQTQAQGPVRKRAFGRAKLNDAEDEGRHRGKGMNLDLRGGVEEWRQRHLKHSKQPGRNGNVTSIYIYLSNVKFNSLELSSTADAPRRPAVPDRRNSSVRCCGVRC